MQFWAHPRLARSPKTTSSTETVCEVSRHPRLPLQSKRSAAKPNLHMPACVCHEHAPPPGVPSMSAEPGTMTLTTRSKSPPSLEPTLRRWAEVRPRPHRAVSKTVALGIEKRSRTFLDSVKRAVICAVRAQKLDTSGVPPRISGDVNWFRRQRRALMRKPSTPGVSAPLMAAIAREPESRIVRLGQCRRPFVPTGPTTLNFHTQRSPAHIQIPFANKQFSPSSSEVLETGLCGSTPRTYSGEENEESRDTSRPRRHSQLCAETGLSQRDVSSYCEVRIASHHSSVRECAHLVSSVQPSCLRLPPSGSRITQFVRPVEHARRHEFISHTPLYGPSLHRFGIWP